VIKVVATTPEGGGCCDEEELRTPPSCVCGKGRGGYVVWLWTEKNKDTCQLTFEARAGVIMTKKNSRTPLSCVWGKGGGWW
jgi:hypothetical protein